MPLAVASANSLLARRTSPRDSHEKAHAFETLLRQSRRRALHGVHVQLRDGSVVLSGTVKSYFLKQLAQEAVRPLAIGMRIENELNVN